jgi:hypothetical protein
VRFQVLAAASMKMIAFWDTAPWSLTRRHNPVRWHLHEFGRFERKQFVAYCSCHISIFLEGLKRKTHRQLRA